jgi:3-phenylpropionate/trans-cinnamate dioxygenase ferredoxin component
MNDWIDVAPADGIAEGAHVVTDVDGIPVAVFNLGGEFYAVEDACTHDGAEIASGRLDGAEIVCPRHGARFCVKTGKVLSAPAYEDLTCFPVRIEAGMVQVRDARWD